MSRRKQIELKILAVLSFNKVNFKQKCQKSGLRIFWIGLF